MTHKKNFYHQIWIDGKKISPTRPFKSICIQRNIKQDIIEDLNKLDLTKSREIIKILREDPINFD